MLADTNTEVAPVDAGGSWQVVWRPEMAPLKRGELVLEQDGSRLSASLTTPVATARGEGTVDGQRLSWSLQFPDGGVAWQFDAVVEGDQLEGTVRPTGRQTPFDRPASLSGARTGAASVVRSHEGSDALADALVKCGVEYVFGYLGGCVPAMHRSVLSHGIPSVAGRTELSAAWMSYGYNRVRNRAASAALVWCVGALHASPVVYSAKQDSTPLLLLTMESAPAWDVRDILQDAGELYSSLKPLAKYIRRLVDPEDLATAVRQGVIAASSGKFGAAVLNLTHTTMLQRTPLLTEKLVMPAPAAAGAADLDRAVALIKAAQRPVLMVGAGIHMAGAAGELRAFAEATGIPVVSSGIGGRGVLADDHPLYAGALGMFSGVLSGDAVADDADLWIALGYSFSQTSTTSWSGPRPAEVIHVDVEPTQIGATFQPSLPICADAGEFLRQMLERTRSDGPLRDAAPDPRLPGIAASKAAIMGMVSAVADQDPLTPLTIGAALTQTLPADALVVGDEGVLVPGMMYSTEKYPDGMAPALGAHYMSLGSGLPAAIGAKLAAPDRLVVCYEGDAGFYYSCADLSTLAELDLKIVVIVNNNGGLFGGPSAGQAEVGIAAMFGDSPWLDLPAGMDYVKVANGFGVAGERVEAAADLGPAIRRAVEAPGAYLLDVRTDGVATYAAMGAALAGSEPRKLGHLDKTLEDSWPGDRHDR